MRGLPLGTGKICTSAFICLSAIVGSYLETFTSDSVFLLLPRYRLIFVALESHCKVINYRFFLWHLNRVIYYFSNNLLNNLLDLYCALYYLFLNLFRGIILFLPIVTLIKKMYKRVVPYNWSHILDIKLNNFNDTILDLIFCWYLKWRKKIFFFFIRKNFDSYIKLKICLNFYRRLFIRLFYMPHVFVYWSNFQEKYLLFISISFSETPTRIVTGL